MSKTIVSFRKNAFVWVPGRGCGCLEGGGGVHIRLYCMRVSVLALDAGRAGVYRCIYSYGNFSGVCVCLRACTRGLCMSANVHNGV